MNDFELYKLKNGMEALLIPRKESPSTTVMVTVKVGSKYETKEISGLSHFLEHMAFKGTKKRPTTLDITSELESIGASYNATTGQERTNYYAKAANKYFDNIFDVISDLYLNPVVPEAELEKERNVIIEEINMYEDIPMQKVFDDFSHVLYGDQPAGWPIIGKKDVVKSVKRDDFIGFRKQHYTPSNTILTVAGRYHENIKQIVEDVFGDLEEKPETKMPEVLEQQDRPRECVRHKESDQTHLVLGFRAFSIHDRRRFALGVLSTILGGGMSSRLFRKIRIEMGAAYYAGSSNNLDTNSGWTAARAGVSNDKVESVIESILDEYKDLRKNKVSREELELAKGFIIGNMFLNLETSDDVADFYTSQLIKGADIKTANELAKQINSVTADDIKSVANDLFVNNGLNLALIGPFKDKSFGDILKV